MIWLVGAGGMSVDYTSVLKAQEEEFIVIGRGQLSALTFEEKTGHPVILDGLEIFLNTCPKIPDAVIVSVGVEQLYETTLMLLKFGVKRLLVEKPGGLCTSEISDLELNAKNKNAQIFIAYNRRFYSSVITAQDMIARDGGVTSFNFELTEWGHVIEKLEKPKLALEKWFLGNSSHVADMAFFLGNKPQEISCFTSGSLSWHPSSSVFAGAGVSVNGALFNYAANWESAGRWSVEVLTNKNRYVFRPMESLQVQKRGTIPLVEVEVDDKFDKDFKPGLYLQVKAFIEGDTSRLCSIEDQLSIFSTYEKMAGYAE